MDDLTLIWMQAEHQGTVTIRILFHRHIWPVIILSCRKPHIVTMFDFELC